MKKFLFASLVSLVVLSLVLTGCPSPTPVETPTPAAPAPTTPVKLPGEEPTSFTKFAVEDGAKIVFSGWGDETEQKIYRDSIERFNKIYPNVTVDFQPIPADFQTTIKARWPGAQRRTCSMWTTNSWPLSGPRVSFCRWTTTWRRRGSSVPTSSNRC